MNKKTAMVIIVEKTAKKPSKKRLKLPPGS
jgi:hypothetical protein